MFHNEKIISLLEGARNKIKHPRTWTRYALARDDYGNRLSSPTDENAVSWCAAGALEFVHANSPFWKSTDIIDEAYRLLKKTIDAPTVAHFNDYSTHSEVIQMFDKVIETLKNNG